MLGLGRVVASPQSGQRRQIVVFATATLFYWAALYLYVPILPVYSQSMGASLVVVGLVVAAYGFSQLLLRIPIGLASDRWGRRKPFCVAGLLVASAGCVVLIAAPTPDWLVIGRGIVGISAAAWVTITVMFSDWFPSEQVPGAMALLVFLSGMGQLVSTGIGGRIADVYGWKSPFFVALVMGIIGAAILLLVPEERSTRASSPGWARMVEVGTAPRLLRVSAIGAMLQFFFWATTYAFVPIYANELGASRTTLGLLTSGALIPYTIAAYAVSRWIGRWGALRCAMIGLILCAVSAGVVPAIHDVLLLGLSQALGGLGRGFTMPVLLGLSIQSVAPAEKATAMGVFQAVYAIGMFLGPATAGVIAETLGLTDAFLISAVMCVAGLGLLAVERGRSVRRSALEDSREKI
ncbi:MAG: MFS transporter [Chloroflexota bacterium]